MKFILGKKMGMGQIFEEDGTVVPVTVVSAEPIKITQIKTLPKDGYEAVQFGSGKNKKGKPRHLKEMRGPVGELKIDETFDVSVFNPGDQVKVSGISKGKGFQGAVKRHGFHGMPASHGHKHVKRHVGSIGQRFPQHTLRGMRMAGRMGGVRATTRGLKVIKVDVENNIIAVKGAIPGNKRGMVTIQTQ